MFLEDFRSFLGILFEVVAFLGFIRLRSLNENLKILKWFLYLFMAFSRCKRFRLLVNLLLHFRKIFLVPLKPNGLQR